MGIPRTTDASDAPRRNGLKLRPSLNQELSALATLDGLNASDLLNVAVAEYIRRRRASKAIRGGSRSSKRAALSA